MKTDKTVLIAEPTRLLSSELHRFLADKNFTVLWASSLKETLLTLQAQTVDVLVLDAALLEQDCGFLSIIKGMEENLPIIICAETNTPEFESTVRKHRIFFYHLKAFGTQDLEMAISNAIQKSSYY